MEFQPAPELLDYWRKTGIHPATEADLALLEERLEGDAPPAYRAFMLKYGEVRFNPVGISDFKYRDIRPGQEVVRTQCVSFIKRPEVALKYYEGLSSDPEVEIPSHLLPFAMDCDQGELLVEFGRPTERIFYWNFAEHDWDAPKAKLYFVANDINGFLDSLTNPDD